MLDPPSKFAVVLARIAVMLIVVLVAAGIFWSAFLPKRWIACGVICSTRWPDDLSLRSAAGDGGRRGAATASTTRGSDARIPVGDRARRRGPGARLGRMFRPRILISGRQDVSTALSSGCVLSAESALIAILLAFVPYAVLRQWALRTRGRQSGSLGQRIPFGTRLNAVAGATPSSHAYPSMPSP